MITSPMPTEGRRKPLAFLRVLHPLMRQACIEIVSHAKTRKGYKPLRPRNGKQGAPVDAHRLAYMSKHGADSIPSGWEVDHICGNRACVNRGHLRLLTVSDHKRLTNAYRNVDRKEAVWADWMTYRPSPAQLAERHGFKPGTITKWIVEWELKP